jgi:hypothetical protein
LIFQTGRIKLEELHCDKCQAPLYFCEGVEEGIWCVECMEYHGNPYAPDVSDIEKPTWRKEILINGVSQAHPIICFGRCLCIAATEIIDHPIDCICFGCRVSRN